MLTMSGFQTRKYSRSNHPSTNTQNNCVYDTARKKSSVASHRLIKGHKHFSESVMVSVAVSKAGNTSVHFIDKEPR